MDQALEIAKQLGLTPAAAGTGIVLALLLRYARGMVTQITSAMTYGLALAFGGVGALMERAPAQPAQQTAHVAATLAVFVLVLQKLLELLATRVPWLPLDNEWTKPATKED